MIVLITGQPGNGKTLYTLSEVAALSKKDSRPVFYSGITLTGSGPTEDWQPLGEIKERVVIRQEDGVDKVCFDLPENAIVVIDEAQRLFRVRAQGAKVPNEVAAFETHRHEGIDFFLMTQHPQLIDTNVRKLTGRHHHLVRRFGFESATRYQWEECRDVSSESARADALKKNFKFPKAVYAWYVSARAHTVKKDFPLSKLAVLVGGVLLVLVAIGVTVRHISNMGQPSSAVAKSTPAAVGPVQGRNVEPSSRWTAGAWRERLPGVSASRPVYDEAIKVVSFPKIAGCGSLSYSDGKIDCFCTSQQGTTLPMSVRQCLSFLKEGWFDFTDVTDRYEAARQFLPGPSNPAGDVSTTVSRPGAVSVGG